MKEKENNFLYPINTRTLEKNVREMYFKITGKNLSKNPFYIS
ncbi:hypothetical protein TPE_1234 [Treponema pedis str. T A4]|uniref:Uncharacterized protein n=1 Tax=Treponema pedis str. T A4 TaxID=1291379 RepID=S6A8F3_9SPIR|nr:hypothetical protein TPE_1234 [Treponema pedis str. T A4]